MHYCARASTPEHLAISRALGEPDKTSVIGPETGLTVGAL